MSEFVPDKETVPVMVCCPFISKVFPPSPEAVKDAKLPSPVKEKLPEDIVMPVPEALIFPFRVNLLPGLPEPVTVTAPPKVIPLLTTREASFVRVEVLVTFRLLQVRFAEISRV